MRRNVIDRMALLCTLHADGPRTLRLLREAGCTTIDKLSQLQADKVALLLGLPPAAARRLTREALRLLERLEPDLEQEEVTYPQAARTPVTKPPPRGFRLDELEQEQEEVEPGAGRLRTRADLDLRDRALLDRVVERWRSDEASKEEPRSDRDATLRQVEIQEGTLRAVDPSAAETIATHAAQLSIPLGAELVERLRPSDLPGLDPEACAALERAGVRSLEDLATCPIDELVSRARLPFTRSRTLQFLAGRQLAERPGEERPSEGEPAPAERLSPREAPPLLEPVLEGSSRWLRERPDDGGVAGPFA